MRADLASRRDGYFHQMALYGSDAEFVQAVVPFVAGGVAADQPTLVTLDEPHTALLRAAMADVTGVTFLDAAVQHANPAVAIRRYRDLLAGHVTSGASRVRVVGDVPHPGTGSPWDGWARYEAVVNHAYGEFPLWKLCPYDRRITPGAVLADVERTHPYLATGDGGHQVNDRYEDPRTFLASRSGAPDPIEVHPPAVTLAEPTPAAARGAVAALADHAAVDPESVDGLMVAVSEAISNAILHGESPILLRAWAAPDRLVVAVSDAGPGPADPFAGLMPCTSGDCGGLGLWIAHQMCSHVSLERTSGFTIHLVSGAPSLVI